MINRVVLPGLRTARAYQAFMAAAERGADLNELFNTAIDTLEEGASRWGKACPECRELMVWDYDHRQFFCYIHGAQRSPILLIGWDPVIGWDPIPPGER